MIKTRTWVIGAVILLVLLAGASVFLLTRPARGTVANIYQDGKCIHSVNLSEVTQPYEITVSDEHGSNVIRVEAGRICVWDADCPDRVCVNAGWLCDSVTPIVCLPHRLVIRIEQQAESVTEGFDAVAR